MHAGLGACGVCDLIDQLRFDGLSVPVLALTTPSAVRMVSAEMCTPCVLKAGWRGQLREWVFARAQRTSGFFRSSRGDVVSEGRVPERVGI